MARKLITEEQKQNIIFLYSSHSCREISILMGISQQTVYNVINEKGIKKRKHTKVDYDGIRADYSNGFTDVKFLSKKYNCCEMVVYKALDGIEKVRTVKIPNNEITTAIRQKSRTDETMSQIARRFNVSRQYVYELKEKIYNN